jgi:hypothetical protein
LAGLIPTPWGDSLRMIVNLPKIQIAAIPRKITGIRRRTKADIPFEKQPHRHFSESGR